MSDLLKYITPDGEVVFETADQILDRMKEERARGYKTVVTVLETGKSYEVRDAQYS